MDIKWFKVESWHILKDSGISVGGSDWYAKSLCGVIQRPWDQAVLDRLPGGSEKSCENCLIVLSGEVDTSKPAPKKRKSRKK